MKEVDDKLEREFVMQLVLWRIRPSPFWYNHLLQFRCIRVWSTIRELVPLLDNRFRYAVEENHKNGFKYKWITELTHFISS